MQTLEYMQSLEIMHRDLKPQNLLLDDQFNIKFIDFGDAKKENEPPFEEDEDPGTLSESADTENEKNFLDDIVMALRPKPPLLELPTIDDVTVQYQRFAFVVL